MLRFVAIVCALAAAYFLPDWIHGVAVAPPTITSITTSQSGFNLSVNQGTIAGGTPVIITGTGLGTTTGVTFGATSAGTNWWINSPTSITVSSPAARDFASGGGTVDIRVTNIAGRSPVTAADQFTYVVPSAIPTVTSVTPNSDGVAGGDPVLITGTNISDAGCGSNLCKVCFDTTCQTSFPSTSTGIGVAAPAHAAGTVHITLVNSSGTSIPTNADLFTYGSPAVIPPIPATATRPSYNTGNGFFVVGRGIYDANGNLFTPVGANWTHFDWSENERFATGVSAERSYPFFRSTDTFHSSAQEGIMTNEITNFVVPIPTIFNTDYDLGPVTTGSNNITTLQAAYKFFVRDAANWATRPFNGTSFTGNQIAWFNPANEWGPCGTDAKSADYLTGWTGAIQAMRAAGFTAPIVVDAGCSGQGAETLMQYAAAIEAIDPLHNIIFSIHLYASFFFNSGAAICSNCGFQFAPTMASLAQLTVPVIVGEFGCANCQVNAGTSPVTTAQIIQTSMNYQFGYLAWAWDDSSGAYYCQNGAISPCHPLQLLGTDSLPSPSRACYKNAAGTDITGTAGGTNVGLGFGDDVITTATYGILAAAKVATVFNGTRPAPGVCPF